MKGLEVSSWKRKGASRSFMEEESKPMWLSLRGLTCRPTT